MLSIETLVDKSVIKNSRRAVYVNPSESTVSTIASLIAIEFVCVLSFTIVLSDAVIKFLKTIFITRSLGLSQI